MRAREQEEENLRAKESRLKRPRDLSEILNKRELSWRCERGRAPKLRRSWVVRLAPFKEKKRRGHTHELGAATFLESECIEFFRGVAVERRDFEEEGKRDINTYSNHSRYAAAAFQKCWNSWDGWLHLIRNELALAAREGSSLSRLLLAILSTSQFTG